MDWDFCWGFRFIGSAYGDILYTKYKIQDKSVFLPTETITSLGSGKIYAKGVPSFIITKDTVRVIRGHLDFEMGIGWGAYFGTNDWHFDASATYGFQIFFDQNMFRHYDGGTIVGSYTMPNGDLFVQGLTISARVDF
jgi:hypothetical protein